MATQRCPECGGRLTSNYCDICMRKVPFAGARSRNYRDPWDYSCAHRQEAGHKCITFDAPKQTSPKPAVMFPKQKTSKKSDPKPAAVIAIVLGLLSLLPTLFGIFENVHMDNPVPEYNVEVFTPEADLPVVQPTEIYSDGEIEILADSLGMYYEEPSLSFLIDNYSDREIDVVVDCVAVNGSMLDADMSVYVNSGESCQAFLMLHQEDLKEANIQQISRVDLSLWIFDADTYDEIAYLDLVTIETDVSDI